MKKLLFIDHSFHQQTKSSRFMIDLLSTQYSVDVIYDDSWRQNKSPNISKVSLEYHVIVFFQIIPEPHLFKKIRHPNIVFFPMYDQSCVTSLLTWLAYRNIKIINFSKTLHDKLSRWGFQSFYVQYFIEPLSPISSINNKVFFWQRINSITINTVCKLFENDDVKIHLHSAVDPNQTLTMPTKEQEETCSITYSQWFNTRQELDNCVVDYTFYIAPRVYEGIGMSFLEAMARGMIVVAHNAPTMNEYIEHGKNGFLFDYDNPKALDANSFDLYNISQNAFTSVQQGYINWKKDKEHIGNYLECSSKKFTFKMQTCIDLIVDSLSMIYTIAKKVCRKIMKNPKKA